MNGLLDRPPFFGEPWPSGVCDTGVQVPTPVGELCVNCDEPIEEGQQGTFIGVMRDAQRVSFQPSHKECSLRAVLGGIAHIRKTPDCPCQGGNDPDGGYSRRDSALLVWEWIREHGVPV